MSKFDKLNKQILRLRDKELLCDVKKAEIQAQIQAKKDSIADYKRKLQSELDKMNGVEPTLIETLNKTDKGKAGEDLLKTSKLKK